MERKLHNLESIERNFSIEEAHADITLSPAGLMSISGSGLMSISGSGLMSISGSGLMSI